MICHETTQLSYKALARLSHLACLACPSQWSTTTFARLPHPSHHQSVEFDAQTKQQILIHAIHRKRNPVVDFKTRHRRRRHCRRRRHLLISRHWSDVDHLLVRRWQLPMTERRQHRVGIARRWRCRYAAGGRTGDTTSADGVKLLAFRDNLEVKRYMGVSGILRNQLHIRVSWGWGWWWF